ncbi:hypothetical protein MP638_001656 [Amoeboaphelidium occidentale]|nr:hypothetical protein MP638_001656 [Amoeboaphelidium occidentale]
MMFSKGEILGKYVYIKDLAEGSFGTVALAKKKHSGDICKDDHEDYVAIKHKKQMELKNEAKATDDQNDQVNKTKSFKPNIGNAIKASLDQLTVAMRKQKSAELKRLREEAATKKPQLIVVPGLSISPNDAVTYENLEEKIDQMLQNGASYSIQTVGSLEKRSNVTYKTAMELSKLEFAKLEREKAKLTKQIEIMSILNEGVEAPADPEGDNEKISAEAQ